MDGPETGTSGGLANYVVRRRWIERAPRFVTGDERIRGQDRPPSWAVMRRTNATRRSRLHPRPEAIRPHAHASEVEGLVGDKRVWTALKVDESELLPQRRLG